MPSSIGGTPKASAISRAAPFFSCMKSMSFGVRLMVCQQQRPAGIRAA
jgi:hypothetical protein